MSIESILSPKITLPHIALAKGWVNGLNLHDLGDRYLAALGADDGTIDLRVIKSTLSRALHELANAATRNGIEGAAILFRQANRIRANPSPPGSEDEPQRPSFDDFLLTVADAEEFSHEELLEAYNNRFPAESRLDVQSDKALARRARLIDRQLKLIALLQPLASAPVQRKDRVAGWFEVNIAERVEAAGFHTIGDLCAAIARDPDSWYANIRGIGKGKADRIARYLRSQIESFEDECSAPRPVAMGGVPPWNPLGVAPVLTISALASISEEPGSALRPSLLGKEDLDGSRGRLRDHTKPSAIKATNDYEAMKTWLSLKSNKQTVVLYEREVTRLIAWSIQVKAKPLSSLTLEDAIDYRDFLGAVPETALIKKGPRTTPASELAAHGAIAVAGFTKPGLKASSIKKALVIIRGFFSWLVKVCYVTANPFVGVHAVTLIDGVGKGSTVADDVESLDRARERRETVRDRALPQEAVDAVMSHLDRPHPDANLRIIARARFIFIFAITLGLRISEIASARRDDLEYLQPDVAADAPGGWILHVVGKGDKLREVPVPDFVVAELEAYLEHRGLLSSPCPSLAVPKGTFLIGALPHESGSAQPDQPVRRSRRYKPAGDGVRPQTIHLALKDLFREALAQGNFRDEVSREKLSKASAHWLRHAAASRSVSEGAPLEIVAEVLGHADISTTSIYIHPERKRKMREMQRLWSKGITSKAR